MPSPPQLVPADTDWRSRPRRTAKISHLLASDLRRQILRGELRTGEHLPPEAELTAALDVSRETLREALRILESQSLVEIRRGRGGGAIVRRPGLASVGRYVALLLQLRDTTVADLEEARAVVEPPAAAQLATRVGDDDLDRLAALHDDERAADGDPLAFAGAVASFDQAVTELSGNGSVAVIAGVLRDVYAGQVYAAIDTSDAAAGRRIAAKVVAAHAAFLDAARRRDATLATDAWLDYLAGASRVLVSRARSRQPIDVVPLWRAQVSRAGADHPRRAATAVATEIRSRIAEGRLRDGDRLPSLADLSDEFGISRPTLREALRILEMEFLLDLRTGDRAGARICHPSTQVAAQLTGTIFEARRTTLVDFARAVRLVEPPMMALAATRIGAAQLKRLRAVEGELAAAVDDVSRFMKAWRDGVVVAFTATRNPALAVVAEILQWVRVAIEPALSAEANEIPGVVKSNRKAHARFVELVAALADGDGDRAGRTWAAILDAPFVESSALGGRLMIDLID